MAVTVVSSGVNAETTTSVTAHTVTLPTVADGDLLLIQFATASGSSVTVTASGLTGLTLQGLLQQSGHSNYLHYKQNLLATDSATVVTFTTSIAVHGLISYIVLRGASISSPLNQYGSAIAITANVVNCVTGTTPATSVGGAVDVEFIFSAATPAPTTFTAPAGYTRAAMRTAPGTAGVGSVMVGYKNTVVPLGGAAGGVTWVADLGGAVSSWVVAVAPVPVAPVAGFSSSVSGTTVTFTDASTAGANGDALTWAWTFGDSTTSTAQNPVHTYPSGGTFVARLTVTSSNGLTSQVTHSVSVIQPATLVTYQSVTSGTGWVTGGGSGALDDLLIAISDTDATTYAQSPANPSAAVIGGQMFPLTAAPAGTGIVATIPIGRYSGSTSGSFTATLYEGPLGTGTLRSTVAGVTIPDGAATTAPGAAQTVTVTFPASDVASIGDYTNLYLYLSVTVA